MASRSNGTNCDDTVYYTPRQEYRREHVDEVSRVTWVGVGVNIGLAVIKSAAGIYARSNVLLADAVHTVSDLATDVAILIGVKYWSAPADVSHPHGHRKIETMITLAIGVALAVVGLGMGYEAVDTLADALISGKEPHVPASRLGGATLVALLVAAVSIAAKELLYRYTARKGLAVGSSALVANAWHHRSDAISSIPPLLALGGEFVGKALGYNLWYLDPVGTVVVCVMLLQAAWDVMQPTLAALLDASADRSLCSSIRKTVLGTDGVIDAHRIRTRVICSNAVAVDLHVIVDQNLTVARGHDIATDVTNRLRQLKGDDGAIPVDVLVHIEPGDPMDRRLPGPERKDTLVDWKMQE